MQPPVSTLPAFIDDSELPYTSSAAPSALLQHTSLSPTFEKQLLSCTEGSLEQEMPGEANQTNRKHPGQSHLPNSVVGATVEGVDTFKFEEDTAAGEDGDDGGDIPMIK